MSAAAASPNALLPGDLAVWDDHVAIIAGSRVRVGCLSVVLSIAG
jgi:hypothetical protein